MSQPDRYERTKNFQENAGDATDHAALNNEFDAAARSINQLRANIALIQDDDGSLASGSVSLAQLSDSLKKSLKGEKGDKGDAGPQGAEGPQGPEGARGPKGDAGASFNADYKGALATRSIYDATAKGTSFLALDTGRLYWKLSDDSGDWSAGVDFGKGDKGDTGATGPQGPEGPQGPAGLPGVKGDQGEKGDAGADGLITAVDTTTKSTSLIGRRNVTARLVVDSAGRLSINLSSE